MSEPVGVHKILAHEELPEKIRSFREIIRKFKGHVFKSLESPDLAGKASAQDPKKVNDAVNKIITFGNIITSILHGKNTQELEKVINFFSDNNFNFLDLNNEEKELCKYYIHIDIYQYPYDINGHSTQ
jgi:hypothetical protein